MHVMVLAIGPIPYYEYSHLVLSDYFKRHNISHTFVREANNPRALHASWLKLLSHTIIPGFEDLLCWDLDLLPIHDAPNVCDVVKRGELNMAVDTSLLVGHPSLYLPNFRFNGGLMLLPRRWAMWAAGIYYRDAPGDRPSAEQYYLNDAIIEDRVPVVEIPQAYNTLHPHPDYPAGIPLWEAAYYRHYTFGLAEEAKVAAIHGHCDKYFWE